MIFGHLWGNLPTIFTSDKMTSFETKIVIHGNSCIILYVITLSSTPNAESGWNCFVCVLVLPPAPRLCQIAKWFQPRHFLHCLLNARHWRACCVMPNDVHLNCLSLQLVGSCDCRFLLMCPPRPPDALPWPQDGLLWPPDGPDL